MLLGITYLSDIFILPKYKMQSYKLISYDLPLKVNGNESEVLSHIRPW